MQPLDLFLQAAALALNKSLDETKEFLALHAPEILKEFNPQILIDCGGPIPLTNTEIADFKIRLFSESGKQSIMAYIGYMSKRHYQIAQKN